MAEEGRCGRGHMSILGCGGHRASHGFIYIYEHLRGGPDTMLNTLIHLFNICRHLRIRYYLSLLYK